MATIFYWTNTGSIYGVHPDNNIALPDGISFITVAQTPDKISWPVPNGHSVGCEKWTKVNLTTQSLEIDSSKLPDDNNQFDKMGTWLKALAIWTRLKLNALRNDPLTTELPRTAAQQKAEIVAIYKGLQ